MFTYNIIKINNIIISCPLNFWLRVVLYLLNKPFRTPKYDTVICHNCHTSKKFDLYGWRLLSACHPIVYSMPCHPSFHFSVNHGCGNNGKCSTSFS